MRISVPTEVKNNEYRVALTPAGVHDLVSAGHEVIVFQVLDPAELEFSFDQPTVFQDVESDRTLFIDPAAAKREYLRKLDAHESGLRTTCQKLGASFHRVATNQPLELVLFDFLQDRTRRRRPVSGTRDWPTTRSRPASSAARATRTVYGSSPARSARD